jgi:DNA processing protein
VEGAPLPALERCVALVGSRAASPYGLAMAGRLARDLGAVGIAIVSGLARGIDAAAHRGAIAAGAATIAVVPCGLDTAAAIADPGLHALVRRHGTLLSEVPSGPPFGRGAFVRRNRLIAALAAVTVVVEAAERSGALSTAAAAARLGRARGAVPGDLDRPTARGVLALLRAGARPVGDASDVVAMMPRLDGPRAEDIPGRVLAALDAAARTADSIAERAGVSVPVVLAALLLLRWSGLALDAGGQRWRRAGSPPA